MLQLLPLILRSSKPSSPWPVAPWPPRNESARSAARHGSGPATAVVLAGVVTVTVGVVVVLGAVVLVVAVLAAAAELEPLLALLEPPQAASVKPARITSRAAAAERMTWCSGITEPDPSPSPASISAHLARPPGTHQPRPRRKLDWELIACGFRGHELIATDAAHLHPEDAVFARDQGACRWHRCLRCDSWLPLPRPEKPAREYPPPREEIAVPLRGKALRDKVVLRLIAVDRALHFVILTLIGIGVLAFAANEKSLHDAFYRVLTDLQGGVAGGPVQNAGHVGLLHELDRLFSLRSGTLREAGIGLLAYGVLEGVEAVGLWYGKRWAEYLTFIATSILLPLEIYEIIHRRSALKVIGFLINLAVVIYLIYAKRLFGVRGGGAADAAERAEEMSWEAIEEAMAPC